MPRPRRRCPPGYWVDELAHAVEALVAVVAAMRFHVRGADLWSQIAVLTRGWLLAANPAC
ncbi:MULTISPECIES: hypothetical protein [Streptacidiphilus]|uniref:Transposase n=1 Tax=Streptacidiphilus cavernicola TaxID=3342716 RepID=A0ABV6UP68_9ACTN|nr:hypothetical protein [Streptacidiphilus jeojiense]